MRGDIAKSAKGFDAMLSAMSPRSPAPDGDVVVQPAAATRVILLQIPVAPTRAAPRRPSGEVRLPGAASRSDRRQIVEYFSISVSRFGCTRQPPDRFAQCFHRSFREDCQNHSVVVLKNPGER
jgi:hypothetical protein